MGSIYKNGIAYTSGGGGASDSGWQALDGTSAVNPDYKFYYRKVGAFVYVQCYFKLSSNITSNQTVTLFTLPEGFRPKIFTPFTLKQKNGESVTDYTYSNIRIGEGGACVVKTGSTTMSNATQFVIDVAFVVA